MLKCKVIKTVLCYFVSSAPVLLHPADTGSPDSIDTAFKSQISFEGWGGSGGWRGKEGPFLSMKV